MAGRAGRSAIFFFIFLLTVLLAFIVGWYLGPGRPDPAIAPVVSLDRYRPLVYLVAEDYAKNGDVTLGRAVFAGWDVGILSRELTLVAEQEGEAATRQRLLALRDALADSWAVSPGESASGDALRQFLDSLLRDRALYWMVMLVAATVIALFSVAVFFALRVLMRPPSASTVVPTEARGISTPTSNADAYARAVEKGLPALRRSPAEQGRESNGLDGHVGNGDIGRHSPTSVGESLSGIVEFRESAALEEAAGARESPLLDAHTLVGELPEINIVEIADTSAWILARLRRQNRSTP